MSLLSVPTSKKPLFWSADINKLDKQKHRKYIIHQVLQYGSITDIEWLKQYYSQTDIKQTFCDQPRKTYSTRTFNFIKNYLLKINGHLDPNQYVTL
ncbi:MAG: hypothetical protein HN846_01155 [Candidatus Pacebacteria bacterium]|jgi:hypothetical protein|nr:hypothetical protein [Candidatus Paceibacterota bacterium]MBT3511951.1 hypothetical protein [Candidatus Paceibacterota bacterium]MBT4005273.1 hypothetical protein [Candidatus Paceibacterota bacterium]MBT4358993.1 hypothetical protein [Candidatus Paceibacterota bacterium]MBT4681140.1 hypothetical protein [Candidatus Paceibacterota bacterium]